MPSPTPSDLINFALKGMPKIYPLTQEPITVSDVERYLTSAYTEIEMSLGIDLSPVEHYQSVDYVSDMFEQNWCGIKLTRFPATKIINMQLKFPHTQTVDPVLSYTIPASWIILKRNKLNISAAIGSVSVQQGGGSQGQGSLGIFSWITGFARGKFQPAVVEVQYQSGFENDKMPAALADLIMTVAAIRMLSDIGPLLFPFSSTNVSIDAVSQSASLPGPQFLIGKVQALSLKRKELEAAIKSLLGRSIKMAFIGA